MKHIPLIVIVPIDHAEQDYPTCGDWDITKRNQAIVIRVSKMDDYRSEEAVAIHELHEVLRYMERTGGGGTGEEVTAFDLLFEEERERGLHKKDDEPGDDLRAPYYYEHQEATKIEKEVCHQSGLPWSLHEANVEKLG